MPMQNFWSNVINPTPASKLPSTEEPPYNDLSGVDTNNPLYLQAGANTLFPLLGQGTNKIPVVNDPNTPGQTIPANFNLAPTALSPADFLSWHTDFQIQYIALHLTPGSKDGLTIGPSGSQITVIDATPVNVEVNNSTGGLTTTPVVQKVYVLQNLQKSDFASMSLADQKLIAQTSYFQNTLADSLGLIPSNTPQPPINPYYDPNNKIVDNSNSSITITTPITNIASSSFASTLARFPIPPLSNGSSQLAANGTSLTSNGTAIDVSSIAKAQQTMDNAITGTEVQIINDLATALHKATTAGKTISLNATDAQVFISEIENIRSQIDGTHGMSGQAVFSPQDIETSLTTIYKRWQTVSAFGSVIPQSGPTSTVQYTNVISQDGGAGVNNAYATFMNAERRVLDLNNSALAAATTGVLENRQLDVPNLIAIFQLYSNLTDQQINLGNTQVITQTNDLLATYGVIQQIVNNTISQFNPTNTSQSLGLNGQTSKTVDQLGFTTAQLQVLSMFDSGITPQQQNPIEAANGVHRPNFNMFDTTNNNIQIFLQGQWNTFATELSDAVTLLNQNSQIQENNVTELQKEQDRHFDLANTALSKAADIIQSIGRNVSD
jgi:hypothetical protein